MSLSYAREKSRDAILGMAGSPKSINARIADAFAFHLSNIRPEEDLPADLRPLLAEIHTAMTATPGKPDEGSFQASAKAMSQDQATEMARKILHLHDLIMTAEE